MSNLTFVCPVCDVVITPSGALEESEIISCADCQSRLVVEKDSSDNLILNQAPEVEEDWGQ